MLLYWHVFCLVVCLSRQTHWRYVQFVYIDGIIWEEFGYNCYSGKLVLHCLINRTFTCYFLADCSDSGKVKQLNIESFIIVKDEVNKSWHNYITDRFDFHTEWQSTSYWLVQYLFFTTWSRQEALWKCSWLKTRKSITKRWRECSRKVL